jgi:peptidyl-prolyl cis-trans isomerase A (cyclophilin A)
MRRTTSLPWILAALAALALLGACERVHPRGDAPSARRLPESERRALPSGDTRTEAAHPASRPDTPVAEPTAPSEVGGEARERLLSAPAVDERAPDQFAIELATTEGPLVIDVTRAWAPAGADHIYTLVRLGYFTDVAFFRVIGGFMAQVGIHGDPAVNRVWRDRSIPDDPVVQSNTRGMVSFATSGPNSRSTQFFINFGDNRRLDEMGFAPFGRVRDMSVADRLHAGYGEGAPGGRGPMQMRIQMQGNAYLRAEFPELDYVESARILE